MTYNPPPNMPPPPPGYGAAPNRLPSQVSTASILLFVSGGFNVLGGLLLFAISALGAFFLLVAIVVLALGLVEIGVGVALRQLKPWARTAGIAVAGIIIVLDILSMIKGGYTSVVGLALAAIVIYMLSQPEAKQAFPTSGR